MCKLRCEYGKTEKIGGLQLPVDTFPSMLSCLQPVILLDWGQDGSRICSVKFKQVEETG